MFIALSVFFFVAMIRTRSEIRFIIYMALFAPCFAVVAIDTIPSI